MGQSLDRPGDVDGQIEKVPQIGDEHRGDGSNGDGP